MRPPGAEEAAQDITRDTKAFTAAIRQRVFTFLRALVVADYEAALAVLAKPSDVPAPPAPGAEPAAVPPPAPPVSPTDAEGQPWTEKRLGEITDAYYATHRQLCLD